MRVISTSERWVALRVCAFLDGTEDWFDLSKHGEDLGEDNLRHVNDDFVATLKGMIDQWIDSGQSGDSQSPTERSIRVVPQGYAQPLYDIISPLWKDVRPRLGLNGDGTVSVLHNPPRPDANDLRFTAKKTAVWWFMKLMLSGSSQSLARCANPDCGGYFVYRRTPKRVIKRGMFCTACKSKGSVRRMRASRDRIQAVRIELAAKLWPAWNPRSHGKRSAWIAQKMNLQLAPTEQIGPNGKWVTQNQTAILSELKRRKNG